MIAEEYFFCDLILSFQLKNEEKNEYFIVLSDQFNDKISILGTKLKLLVFINTMKSIGNREEFELNKRVLPCSSYSYFGKEPMGC